MINYINNHIYSSNFFINYYSLYKIIAKIYNKEII